MGIISRLAKKDLIYLSSITRDIQPVLKRQNQLHHKSIINLQNVTLKMHHPIIFPI